MPSRSRASSLVQSIATRVPVNTDSVPYLYDDQELLQKLRTISLGYDETSAPLKVQPPVSDTKYERYDKYLSDLSGRAAQYQNVIDQTRAINSQLNLTIETFCGISSQTQVFAGCTRQLYDKFNELDKLHESLDEYLSFFEALEPIARGLYQNSSPSVVKKDSFKSKLIKIDTSLQFLDEHSDFKDAEAYRIKFKKCMIRCCSLMASYMNNSLKALHEEIAKSVETATQSATRDALLYNKFSSRAPAFLTVSESLSNRCSSKSYYRYRDELHSILQGCYNDYFQIRAKLLHNLIINQLDQSMVQDKKFSLVKYIQDNLLFFSQLCQNEYGLIVQFFPEGEGKREFNKWLFRLCEPLHDRVREKVLREPEVAALCDSVTLLNKYYQFEEDSKEYEAQYNSVQLDKIFEPLLQDVQYRLIFRAQIYVETNIVNFKPTKEAFIINHRKQTSNSIDKSNDIVTSFLESISELEDETEEIRSCYPPVLRAVALLSRIYQMINSSIFDNLAHHIVHDCIQSLRSAFQLVKQSEDSLEPRLAYLKNLLMLRKQVQNFEIQYVCNEKYVDFSGLADFLRSLAHGGLKRGTSNSVLDLALEGAPRVVNDMVDARSELTLELRKTIKNLTETAAREVLGDCLNTHENLVANNVQLRKNVEILLPRVHECMCNFIKDGEIRTHLIDAIQDIVIRSYASFYEEIVEMAASNKISKDEVSELIYVDVLADFINNTASSLDQL
ncbi:LANO_0F03312g1_1 [Lachancea nothofagi CBS 11611]|uniref:Conserved oligomeric Golgi complex subunit 3 n=1 Tax=Lachancea nothofagi CBS 11611 TaxID=1266666 RepID=A0A1G4K739_9SACH|nr:LANO_0F03312g1_1 [Lachancea nothofagi CBS 11611]